MKITRWEDDKTNFDRNLAVVIGIDFYNIDGIHNLSTPVSDARAIADLLQTDYDYKEENIIRLFSPCPNDPIFKDLLQAYPPVTLDNLRTLLTDTIPNQLKPGKYDRLIFYFAGHGIPCNSDDGPQGYLVPQNADWKNPGSFLPMSEVYEALSKLECHHLLVILDCCFAGTFRWASNRKMIPILETVRREHYDRFIRYPAWQVITSAAHDQEALDVAKLAEDKRGAVPDKNQELHSPFALALLEGLGKNKADVMPDGVITANELYLYLEVQVSELSGDRQKPGLYPMKLDYDRGEFVFTKPGFDRVTDLKPAPPLNEENNPYRGLKPFEERHSRFFFGRKVLVEELSDRLSQSDRSLTVVLGASGCGKSSLVKAGLIPDLRQESALNLIKACILTEVILAALPQFPLKFLPIYYVQQWYILAPMRPERYPFTALAQAILPIAQPELIEQLSQVSFLDEVFKPKDESRQNDSDRPTDARFVKLANFWNSAAPESQILLIKDKYKQLQNLCRNPQETEHLSQLYRAICENIEFLSNRLQNEPQHLNNVIQKWSDSHPNVKLLLTIDQFEELITMSQERKIETHCRDRHQSNSPAETPDEPSAESPPWLLFLQVIERVIRECPQQLHIVLTLRSNFEPRFISSPLSADWKKALFPVVPMKLDELRQAIEEPAVMQALYFEPPELVDRLIEEAGQMPGTLPLLSFTLSELYVKLADRWRKDPKTSDRAIRQADYEELGGVTRSIAKRADQKYEELVKEDGAYKSIISHVMLRMVAVAGEVARRRVTESELKYPQPENDKIDHVIKRFSEARLLTNGIDSEGKIYVEPAHDALMREWQKLREWKQQDLPNILLQLSLNPIAQQWASSSQKGSDRGLLWDENPHLPLAMKLLCGTAYKDTWLIFLKGMRGDKFWKSQSNQLWLNFDEAKFVTDSFERKYTKRRNAFAITLGVFISLLIVTIFAVNNATRAEKRTINADITTLSLLAKSYLNPEQQPEATIDAIRAGRLVRDNDEKIDSDARIQAITALQSVTYNLKRDRANFRLRNRLENPVGQVTSQAKAVTFSKDNLIATAYRDGTIKLWQSDGTLHLSIKAHDKAARSVSFSPDGQTFVSSGDDSTVKLWKRDGSLLRILGKHNGPVPSVSFSPHGKIIASGGADGSIKLWTSEGILIKTIEKAHLPYVQSVEFSPDGLLLASAGDDGMVKLWTSQGNPIASLQHGSIVLDVSFSRDGKILASVGEDKNIKIWRRDGRFLRTFRAPNSSTSHLKSVRSVSFHSGDKIASASTDHTVRIWKIDGTLLQTLKADSFRVWDVTFSPDGQTLASAGDDGTLKLWSDNQETFPRIHNASSAAVSFSPNIGANNQLIAYSTPLGTIEVVDLLKPNLPLYLGASDSSELNFSPNGKILISADQISGTVKSWNFEENSLTILDTYKDTLNANLKFLSSIKFSPNGQLIGIGRDDGKVELLTGDGKQVLQIFNTNNGAVSKLDFSPDSQLIAIGTWAPDLSSNGTVVLGKIENNHISLLKTLIGHGDWVTEVSFSPTGDILASASHDDTIKVWSRNGSHLRTLRGHTDYAISLNFHPDPKMRLLASASKDRTVKLWNIDTGNEIATLRGRNDKINNSLDYIVRFSPDGKLLATTGDDKTLTIWDFDLNHLMKLACSWSGDYLKTNPNVSKDDRKLCQETTY